MDHKVDTIVVHTEHDAIKPVADVLDTPTQPKPNRRFHVIRRRADAIRRLPQRIAQHMRRRGDPPFHDWFPD